MAERIFYHRKTREQIAAFLRAYVALCREHQIVLAPDQDYALCPVAGGSCQHDPEWRQLLSNLVRVTEERREPFTFGEGEGRHGE